MECEFIKSNIGLIPANDSSREWVNKLKLGKTVRGNFVQPRNPLFHNKFFALLQIGYEHFEETAPCLEHKGEPIRPDFERFRKDVTILAGKFHFVTNIRGEVRAEADSISFANMDEETFRILYDKTLQVLLERVLKGPQWNAEKVNQTVERILEFAP
jgi:hypothetical protein